jgi:hypothetical protein
VWITKTFGIGRGKAYDLIAEARKHGYCARKTMRTEAGKVLKVDYFFSDDPADLAGMDDARRDPLPEKPEVDEKPSKPPLPEKATSGKPAHIQRTNSVRKKKDTQHTQPKTVFADGAGDLLIPFDLTDAATIGASAMDHIEAGRASAAKKALGTDKDRLPFTRDTLRKISAMCVGVDGLVKTYLEVAKKTRIKNPNAYLLKMAYDTVAKRDGTPIAVVAQLATAQPEERGKILGAAVGVKRERPEWQRRVQTNPDRSALARTRVMS